jgi:hypothetical protein
MGGLIFHHELESVELLCGHPEAYQIFKNAGWVTFFEILWGFDNDATLEFAQNIDREISSVHGLHIEVKKGIVAEVTGLPRTGVIWFNNKAFIQETRMNFLRGEEEVRNQGNGVNITSLPFPWKDVEYFIQ